MKYFVSYFLHNKVNGGWAYKVVGAYDDYSLARKAYHDELSNYIGGDTFDRVAVTLDDSYGNQKMTEYWEAPVQLEPTPNVEAEQGA